MSTETAQTLSVQEQAIESGKAVMHGTVTDRVLRILDGIRSGGLGILLTAPRRYILPAFLCGFAGRFARDVFMGWGMSQNWSTAVATGVVVLAAVAIIRGHMVSPVVLITGILPLGAAVAMFNAIVSLMKVSHLEGEALSKASVALSANLGKVFTTCLAIALGLSVGIAIVRLFRREEVQEKA